MTAVNFITFNTGVALFADSAIYDPDCRIVRFASKIRTPEGGKLGIITSGSRLAGDELVDALQRRAAPDGPLTFDRLEGHLPDAIADFNRELAALSRVTDQPADGVRVAIYFAGWSDRARDWCGGCAFSWDFSESLPAGKIWPRMMDLWPVEVDGVGRELTPDEVAAGLQRLGLKGFAAQALQAQRRTALVARPEGGSYECVIGGEAELVTITHEASERSILHHWTDEAGDTQDILRARITGEPLPNLVRKPAPLPIGNRAERRRMARLAA